MRGTSNEWTEIIFLLLVDADSYNLHTHASDDMTYKLYDPIEEN